MKIEKVPLMMYRTDFIVTVNNAKVKYKNNIDIKW